MAKRDHQAKPAQPRVLTEAEIHALPVSTLRKLVREGKAVIDDATADRIREAAEASCRAEARARRALRGEEPHRPDQANMPGPARPRSRFEIN
jgi:hypothetical protein